MSISQNTACRRLSSLGFRQETVHQYLNLISKWKRCEGIENTIARLKKLKVAYIHNLGLLEPDLSWISHKGNLPRGPLKTIFTCSKPQKALSALMVYTSDVSNIITKTQHEKFFKSVNGPKPIDTSKRTSKIQVSLPEVEYTPFYEFPITGNVPDLMGFHTIKDPTHADLRSVRKIDGVESIVLANRDRLLASGFMHVGEVTSLRFGMRPVPMGRIGAIQEPGYKLRAVANPHRGLQYLLKPLQESILGELSQSFCDCTVNQERGWKWAQNHLKDGFSVSSVDLSDATNLFPLSFQIEILQTAFSKSRYMLDLVELFELSSKGIWSVHSDLTSANSFSEISWTRGQPLGLVPSFSSFALSHHAVMWMVHEKLGLIDKDMSLNVFLKTFNKYRILGDDIVMDSGLEKTYKKIMKKLGCKISASKTITSDRVAEFASRVITRDAIYLQSKWKLASDRNFMDLMKNLGPKWIEHLRPRQRKIAKALSCIPESHGGLGWNPKGIPLHIREAAGLVIMNKTGTELLHRKDIQAAYAFNRDTPNISQELIVENESWSERVLTGSVSNLPLNSPTRTVSSVITEQNRLDSIRVNNDETIEGYSPMDITTDPRGVTQLDSLESRIGVTTEEFVFPETPQDVLDALASIEAYNNEIANLVDDSGVRSVDSIKEQPTTEVITKKLDATLLSLT